MKKQMKKQMKKLIKGFLILAWVFIGLLFTIAPIILAVILSEWLILLTYLLYPIIGSFFGIMWLFVFTLLLMIDDWIVY